MKYYIERHSEYFFDGHCEADLGSTKYFTNASDTIYAELDEKLTYNEDYEEIDPEEEHYCEDGYH